VGHIDKDTMITPSATYNFIKVCEVDENVNLISFALIQNDKVLAKFCKKPYREDVKQLLFSMTKSFAALAVGIAIDDGLLSLDDYVESFFSEELPERPHPNLLKMKIRHLLTMTTGIHKNTYSELFPQSNWVKAFLAQEFPHEPGTYYRYSTHASHMLSAIIQKVSNTSLEDFLNDSLFLPMDITEAQWEHSPEGLTSGGMGLSLCPASLIKVACMLLNKGIFNEKRIISEEYIALATSPQVIKQDEVNRLDQYFSGFQYGFQFHISPNQTAE
jgi:CubicO group peptidase (beta-lactamase class C family)